MTCCRYLSHTEGVFSGSALWFGSIASFLARTRHGPWGRFTGRALVMHHWVKTDELHKKSEEIC